MSTSSWEIRIQTTHEAKGEIRFEALGTLTTALQALQTRIGRHLVDRGGAGRTSAIVDSLTTLRMTGLPEGSTKILARRGDDTALDLDLPLGQDLDGRFYELINSIAEGRRPEWATDLLAEAASKVGDALVGVDGTAIFEFPGRGSVALDSTHIDASVWKDRTAPKSAEADVVGILEAVDLHVGRFRLRDDISHTFVLPAVANAAAAYPLINTRVRARGLARRTDTGTLAFEPGAELAAVELPAAWFPGRSASLEDVMRSAPGPDPGGCVDLTDEEFDVFLAAVRG